MRTKAVVAKKAPAKKSGAKGEKSAKKSASKAKDKAASNGKPAAETRTHAGARLFGTDGIRGLAGSDALTPEHIQRLGRVLGRYLVSLHEGEGRPQVLLGVDPRPSADLVGTAMTSGLIAENCDVHWPGMMSTPEVAFLSRHGPFNAGVAITASHNPAEDNGIKILGKDGLKLPDDVERKLEREVLSQKDLGPAHPRNARFGWLQLGREKRYEDFIVKTFRASFANLAKRPLRVVFDCAYGARSIDLQTLSNLAKSVQLGRSVPELRVGAPLSTSSALANNALDIVFLNAASPTRPEEQHMINARCGSTHPEGLQAAVRELQADLGVAFDGDGDRCILVDHSGAVRDGDYILALLAIDLREQGHLAGDTVIATSMANLGLEEFLRERGIKLVRTDVGDKFVSEAMRKTGAKLGGEQSGHVIIADEGHDIGDGLYTALRVIEVMLDKGKSLAELCSGMAKHPQVIVNVPITERKPLDGLKKLQAAIRAGEEKLDGGRLVVRYSGTEPKLRVMAEGRDAAMLQQVADDVAKAALRDLGVRVGG